jgi:hypothetical protein
MNAKSSRNWIGFGSGNAGDKHLRAVFENPSFAANELGSMTVSRNISGGFPN